jgi:ubiquinone/menaquinone biosynthesis C-methylase UbiE
MTELEKYYSKFKEEKRLSSHHGTVEFKTSMKYIHDYIPEGSKIKIADIGAGTGRYAVPLSREGHDVTAVELTKANLKVMEAKHEHIKIWPGNALNLSFLPDKTFDITLLFGPLYHLQSKEEKLQALKEATRITKTGGLVFAAYIMNDYSIISYCFGEHKIKEGFENKTITDDFHVITSEKDLYSYLRLEEINELNSILNLKREKIFSQSGPANYIRQNLNSLDEEEFELFIKYQLATCERPELLGAASHLVDIIRVE